MPRSISGVYTLPEASFIAGTTIQSAPVNSDLSDIASALTQSLATTGVSSMTGPIKAADGTLTTPSFTFASDTGTGFYLAGSHQIGLAINGVQAATFNSDLSVTWVGDATWDDGTFDTLTITTSATIAGHPVTNFPVGTSMLFMQTAAPVGWTKQVVDSDFAIRLTTGTVGSGGSVAFNTLFARTGVDGYTLTTPDIPSHLHSANNQSGSTVVNPAGATSVPTASGAASTGLTGGGGSHLHAADMRLKYKDVVNAIKA